MRRATERKKKKSLFRLGSALYFVVLYVQYIHTAQYVPTVLYGSENLLDFDPWTGWLAGWLACQSWDCGARNRREPWRWSKRAWRTGYLL